MRPWSAAFLLCLWLSASARSAGGNAAARPAGLAPAAVSLALPLSLPALDARKPGFSAVPLPAAAGAAALPAAAPPRPALAAAPGGLPVSAPAVLGEDAGSRKILSALPQSVGPSGDDLSAAAGKFGHGYDNAAGSGDASGPALQPAARSREEAIAALTRLTPDAVLFDWDNTLADEQGIVREVGRFLFVELGVPDVPHAEATRVWRADRNAFYDRFFPGIPRDRVNAKFGSILQRLRAEKERRGEPFTSLLPGALETLSALKRRGIPLGVVSNKPHDQLVREMKALGVFHLFDYVQGHAPRRELKPSPQPILEAMQAMGKSGPRLWYIGDEASDVAAARAAGIQGLRFDIFHEDASEAAALTVDGHRDLLSSLVDRLP